MCVSLIPSWSDEHLRSELRRIKADIPVMRADGEPEWYISWYEDDVVKIEKEMAERGLMV